MMPRILQHKKAAGGAATLAAILRPVLLTVAAALLLALSACAAEEEDKAKDKDEKRVVAAEEEDKAKDEKRVVAFGDSLTSGWGLENEKDGFAPQLQTQLLAAGLNATVINAGVAGETSAEGLNRADWMLEDKPDIVVVELGANDMLRGFPVAPLRENLDAIVGKIKQSGAKVLVAGMYASANHGADYREDFRKAYSEVAAKHEVLLYPFFLEGVYDKPELMQDDNKHPNAKGAKVIAKNIAPFVIRALEKE